MRIYEEKQIGSSIILKGLHNGSTFVARDDGRGLYFVQSGVISKNESTALLQAIAREFCLSVRSEDHV